MKRIIALLLCLAMMAGVPAAPAEGAVYQSNFTDDTDGWVPRSMGTATLRLEDGALVIEGREDNWHSPGRDFYLTPGAGYGISVMRKKEAKK